MALQQWRMHRKTKHHSTTTCGGHTHPPFSKLRSDWQAALQRLPMELILYAEEDVALAVATAAALGVGWSAVCVHVLESLNVIPKQPYNDHTDRRAGGGGVPGATGLQREGEVVWQPW